MATSFSCRITIIITFMTFKLKTKHLNMCETCCQIVCVVRLSLIWFSQSFHFNYGCMDGRGPLLHLKPVGVDKVKEIVTLDIRIRLVKREHLGTHS